MQAESVNFHIHKQKLNNIERNLLYYYKSVNRSIVFIIIIKTERIGKQKLNNIERNHLNVNNTLYNQL